MASISWSDRGWTARKSHHLARYKTGSGWSCALAKVGKVNLRRSVLFDACCTKGSVVEVAWGKGVVWVKGGVWSKGAGVVRGLAWGGKGLYMQEDVFQLLVQVIYPDVLLTVFLWDVCSNGPRWCFFQSFVIPTTTIICFRFTSSSCELMTKIISHWMCWMCFRFSRCLSGEPGPAVREGR